MHLQVGFVEHSFILAYNLIQIYFTASFRLCVIQTLSLHMPWRMFPRPIRPVHICPPFQTSISVPSQSESLQFSAGITRGNDPSPKHTPAVLHHDNTHPYKLHPKQTFTCVIPTPRIATTFHTFFFLLFTYIWGEYMYTEMDRRTPRAMPTWVW